MVHCLKFILKRENDMLRLQKPPRLKPGDTVAAVSLSWGGAGDPEILWRYETGKRRLAERFGLNVVELPHTLKGSDYVYHHPEARAADLMRAFADPEIKGIFSCIGGDDSIRMLPYLDFDIIRNNPKVFMGYSDTTITHLICLKAGISSFYGPSILAEFAENIRMFPYTAEHVKKALFYADPIGDIPACEGWTGERVEWLIENAHIEKKLIKNEGYLVLQGEGKVRGRLIGGCLEVLNMAKGTALWPPMEEFSDALLFLETSEEMPTPEYVLYSLRNYGAMGVLNAISGLLFSKPYQKRYFEEYRLIIKKALKEYHLPHLPVFYNMSFGHNEPMCVLPYGAMAEIDCESGTFAILEPGVV